MKTIIIILSIVIVYVLPLWGARRFLKIAYRHKDGIWNISTPDSSDVFWVLLPVGNIIVCIDFIINGATKTKQSVFAKKFFGIK